MFKMRVLLCSLFACVACTGLESSEVLVDSLEEPEIHIVSAHRHRSIDEAPDGRHVRNRRVGHATESTLELLEEIILRTPRESFLHSVVLPSPWNTSHGMSAATNLWIRSSLSNGEVLDLRVYPGFVQLNGEKNLWIPCARERTRHLGAMESWNLSSSSWEEGPDQTISSWSGRNMSLEDFTLDESPLVKEGGGIRKPISAQRFSREECWCVEDGETRPHGWIPSGNATAAGILELADLLQESRVVFLDFYPDGRRTFPAWYEEAPSEQVRCTLEGEVEITLHYYAAKGYWCVEGEDGMLLGSRRAKPGRLLYAEHWASPAADSQD